MLQPDGVVKSMSPQQIADEKFMAEKLQDTWLNSRNEVPTDMISNVGKMKEVIAGDSMTEDVKYDTDSVDFEPTAKHIFAANQLPEASVDDDAFFGRWLLVSMPYTIPPEEQDRRLVDKIEDEQSELLKWSLEGLQRLEEQGGFTGDRSRSETEQMWQKWSSSVKMFEAECLEATGDEGDIIGKDRLMTVFNKYCELKGMASATKQTVTKTITAESGVSHDRYSPDHQNGTYNGLRWTEHGLKIFKHEVTQDDDITEADLEEMLSA